MSSPLTVERVIAILKDEFPVLRKMPLAPDTPLLSAGLLDSFAIVTLLASLDSVLGIDIDVDTVEVEQFETAASITELCVRASKSSSA